MKIIALEEGFLTESAVALMGGGSTDFRTMYDMRSSASIICADPVAAYLDIGEGRIAVMDEAGIDRFVLSLSCPQIPDRRLALKIFREANDRAAEATEQYPDRFSAFASLPCTDPKAAVQEFNRGVTDLGFVGGFVCGTINGEFLDNRKYWPILACAEEHGLPVYVHPLFPLDSVNTTYLAGHEELQGPAWGFTFDAGSHFLRMMTSGVFDEFPDLRIILGHLGETIPFMMDRIDLHLGLFMEEKGFCKTPAGYLRDNLVVTTSGNFSIPSIMCTAGTLGTDNILFSVDWPDERPQEAVDALSHLPLSLADREKIAYRNAERLLKLG